ncbi:MAG: DUF4258 domain-containing protein [Bacteroidetes bacterium]|nr:DUF4258 domain-containing protein [Bacteroidota bacterium]
MKKPSIKHAVYLIILLGIVLYRYNVLKIPTKEFEEETTIIDNLRSKKLIYTQHAECRMDCRYISEEEIKAALQSGRINHQKSDLKDQPCPTYAIEDRTADGQSIRIILADCMDVVKVVTAIDLDEEHQCDCQ